LPLPCTPMITYLRMSHPATPAVAAG